MHCALQKAILNLSAEMKSKEVLESMNKPNIINLEYFWFCEKFWQYAELLVIVAAVML